MASEWERIRQLAGAADRLADRIAGFAPAWLDADEERALLRAGRRVERAAAELAELVDPARQCGAAWPAGRAGRGCGGGGRRGLGHGRERGAGGSGGLRDRVVRAPGSRAGPVRRAPPAGAAGGLARGRADRRAASRRRVRGAGLRAAAQGAGLLRRPLRGGEESGEAVAMRLRHPVHSAAWKSGSKPVSVTERPGGRRSGRGPERAPRETGTRERARARRFRAGLRGPGPANVPTGGGGNAHGRQTAGSVPGCRAVSTGGASLSPFQSHWENRKTGFSNDDGRPGCPVSLPAAGRRPPGAGRTRPGAAPTGVSAAVRANPASAASRPPDRLPRRRAMSSGAGNTGAHPRPQPATPFLAGTWTDRVRNGKRRGGHRGKETRVRRAPGSRQLARNSGRKRCRTMSASLENSLKNQRNSLRNKGLRANQQVAPPSIQ